MLWQIIFLAAGILSLIYYGAICIALKKWDSTFSRFWLVCGSIGIAGSVLIRLYGMPWIVELLIGITVCLLLLAEMKIITGMCGKPLEKGATGTGRRWIIVLGAQERKENYGFIETKTGLCISLSDRTSGCACDRLRRTGER